MQLLSLFLRILIAHLLGDYLFQSPRLAANKHQLRTLAVHGAFHAVLLVIVGSSVSADLRLWWVLAALLITHVAIDAWTSRVQPRDLKLLVVDQSLHVMTISLAAMIAVPGGFERAWQSCRSLAAESQTWIFAGGFVAAVWMGAVVVGRCVSPFADAIAKDFGASRPGLARAGRLIGMLERGLVFLAILLGLEALVGFVVAAKAILRLPEARNAGSRELSEYYLVGTLASVFWSVLIGVTTRALLQASIP